MAASHVHDPSSLANTADFTCTHIDLNVALDFESHTVAGHAVLTFDPLNPSATTLHLDTRDLTIDTVTDLASQQSLPFTLAEKHAVFGSKLSITLPSPLSSPFKLQIAYKTSSHSTACQWLSPSQTAGKSHPYFFTQCQAIHARSLLPCQDSPGVKTPYDASVTVPSALVALMSAVAASSGPAPHDPAKTTYVFKQVVPIPSYLIAIAAGHLVSRELGPRSRVWSEPETVEKGAFEFAETEQMLTTAESLLGPYVWGRYDILLLPPSFPYGGMENPCLTFVTPTLLAGDRSLADVVAHEISHSWTGNLVTNKSWEHFWLNEGFTVYVERKIVGRMHTEQHRHFSAIIGWKALRDSVETYGHDSPLTALVPTLENIDPDDAFSSVPYEKGFNLLFYLETLLGSPEPMERYLKAHVKQFSFKAVTTSEWKAFFLEFFADEAKRGVFDTVNWDAWFYAPGLPQPEPHFDQTLAEKCNELAQRWAQATPDASFGPSDISSFTSSQVVVFLEKLLLQPPLAHDTLAKLDSTYALSASRNAEIRFRWQSLCLRAAYEPIFPQVVDFVTSQGRMKFVRPLYRALFNCEKSKALAVETFKANRESYHNIAANMIAKDLKLA